MSAPVFDRESLRTLSVPSALKVLPDILLTWGVIAAAIFGARYLNSVYASALAIIVIGARQNALATLAHEGWHGLLCSPRSLNHRLGAWLFSYPIGILYYHDRSRHLRHHREVGHDHDPDWLNYTTHNRETPARVVWYLASLLLGRLLISTALSLATKGKPRIAVTDTAEAGMKRPTVAAELFRAVFCQAVLFALMAVATQTWWTYPVFWMLPLATFAGFFANFRALIEHIALRDNIEPEARLRDIQAGPLERFFIAPSHFNYHALHHEHPSIPHYNLPRVRAGYVQQCGEYPFEVWPGYVRAFMTHLTKLRDGYIKK
jgi:fatty acid desaturase